MGGNALKHTFTRRYSKDEYNELCAKITNKLSSATTARIEIIKAYRNKDSFGDMDILIEAENRNYKKLITDLFSPNEINKNGSVYSFDVEELQIDLIVTDKNYFDTSVAYFAWNDLGNLMGRIYKKMGFKYGHKGLYYIVREHDYIFREVLVSNNPQLIFEFGDFDYSRFLKGFDELKDMFEYVTSSKYFNKDIYLLHNRNHKSRVRDSKRVSYREFLNYCMRIDTDGYNWETALSKGHFLNENELSSFLKLAFDKFPGFKDKLSLTLEDFKRAKDFKKKFSGEQVMYLTGLYRNELGEFMQFLRKNNPDLKEFVLESNYQDIVDFILDEFYIFKYKKRC